MRLSTEISDGLELARQGDYSKLDYLISRNSSTVRHLLGMTYLPDSEDREIAIWGLAFAAQYYPKLIKDVVRRLVWAMNDESGTNALTAPDVLLGIARVRPDLLLPVIPDLTRLAGDPGLREGLVSILQLISRKFPGQVGIRMSKQINKQLEGKAG